MRLRKPKQESLCGAEFAADQGNVQCVRLDGHDGPHFSDWVSPPLSWDRAGCCPLCSGTGKVTNVFSPMAEN